VRTFSFFIHVLSLVLDNVIPHDSPSVGIVCQEYIILANKRITATPNMLETVVARRVGGWHEDNLSSVAPGSTGKIEGQN
jgi:hypothetical protein